MVRRVAAAAALLGALTACTSLQHPKAEPVAPAPSASTTDTPSPSPEAEADLSRGPRAARAILRREIRELYTERYGEFLTQMELHDPSGATLEIERRGTYDLRDLRSDFTVTMSAGGETMEVRARSTHSEAWIAVTRLPGMEQPDRTCWIHLVPEVLGDLVEQQIPAGLAWASPRRSLVS